MKALETLFDWAFLGVRAALGVVDLVRRFFALALVRITLRVVGLGSLHAALFLCVVWGCLHRVGAGEVGVRERLFGAGGLEQRDHGPGLRASLRWLEAWHHLDRRTHVIAFGVDAGPEGLPALELRTRDGNVASVSASVLYRIRAGEAWRLVAAGLEQSYPGLARQAAAGVLRERLSALDSADFWDTDLRQARTAEVRRELDARLAALFLEVEAIQLGEVTFRAEYEEALAAERSEREGMRVAVAMLNLEQELRGDPSLGEIDTEQELEAEEERLRAEYDRDLEVVRSEALLAIARLEREAESYARLRASEADALHERETARGNLALELAEAERERGRALALEGPEGLVWLACEAAAALRVHRAQLDSRDPRVPSLFDLDALVQQLLGAAAGQSGAEGR